MAEEKLYKIIVQLPSGKTQDYIRAKNVLVNGIVLSFTTDYDSRVITSMPFIVEERA